MKTTLSAVVLNFRSPRDTITCVESLLSQTLIEEMEILVVDNRSDDESVALFNAKWKSNPKIKILEMAKNFGFGGGLNRAIRNAEGEFVMFINPDNAFPKESLEQMIRFMKEHEDIGILSPGLEFPDGTLRPSARAFPKPTDIISKRLFPARWEKAHQYTNTKDLQFVDWVVGTCLLMKREFFLELGGFDERFFLFFEDTDLCRRVKKAGKKIGFMPGIRVFDRKKRLSEGGILSIFTKKTARIHVKSALKYYLKWAGKTA